uniref:Large ribosomal subunit protein uL24 n=1 Tax=Candidatus Kentrum sp. TC TaxID=2126339 RepID=A0A451A5Q6_9GAMM|nr:MAG: large subunit ribosomal protein L24 [Candidatus Kentron sp. TC]VFK48074.1 MAG: large subunit ribosomal protein L24 [Candidatus Kentron sp. TC]VFK61333.1 MAG: large subunit ribosomal protein L24 [Candidatus Kentron sp. TC]
MRRVRRGDEIVVLTGKDRGKRGKILRMYSDDFLLVEGVNMVKKHMKPNPQKGASGGIVSKEMRMRASNVALYNPATGKGGRVGFRFLDDGRKVRYFKSSGEVVDVL